MGRASGRSLAAPPETSAKSSSSGAGFDALCDAAAAATCSELDPRANMKKQVVEVEAFCSVHDMIHAAIEHYPPPATLRQIYQACEQRGRIAYKRTGGSRLITQNDHWKSQIRHALYTSARFTRKRPKEDLWLVSKTHAHLKPLTTTVTILADEEAPDSSICGASHVGAITGDAVGAGTQATSPGIRPTLNHRGAAARQTPQPAASSPAGRAVLASPQAAVKGVRSTRSRRGRAPILMVRPEAAGKKTAANVSRAGSKEGAAVVYTGESEGVAGSSGERLLAAQAAGMALWQNNSAVEEDNGRVMGSANDLSLLQAGPACPLAGIDMQSVLSAEQLRNLSRDEYCLLLSMLPEPDRRSNESLEALFSRQCFAHACQMLQMQLMSGSFDMRQFGGFTRLSSRADGGGETSTGIHSLLAKLKEQAVQRGGRAGSPTPEAAMASTYLPSASGRSAEADSSSPRGSKHALDRSASEGVVPIKKRLKEAAKADKEANSAQARRGLAEMDHGGALAFGNDSSSRYHKHNRMANTQALPDTSTPVSTPKPVVNHSEADEVGRSLRKGRTRLPPKPCMLGGSGTDPSPSAPIRSRADTPVVATPAIAPPPAVKNATPLSALQLPPPRTTRLTRRTGLRSPVWGSEPLSGDARPEGLSNADIMRTAALACLQEEGVAMIAQDLVRRILDRGLPFKAGKTPEHTMASALYMDMETNDNTPFCPCKDGKFGLYEWGEGL